MSNRKPIPVDQHGQELEAEIARLESETPIPDSKEPETEEELETAIQETDQQIKALQRRKLGYRLRIHDIQQRRLFGESLKREALSAG